jgi:hypothetical protein
MGKLTGSSLQTGAKANYAGQIVRTETSSSRPSVLSSSMIMAVNNAAETARLVLDQAVNENTTDDNGSVSRTRQSSGSGNSTRSHSNSRVGSGGSLIFEDDSESAQGDKKSDDEPQVEVYKNSSLDSSPPPNAFQNFPISRGFNPFHKSTVDVNDVLADGTEFHVTNHFDAAAAISAALASSHLADAAGSIGMLQMPHAKPISRRRSLSESNQPTKPPRKSQSGGGTEDVLATTTTDRGQDTPVRSGSSGLPTPEEAEAIRLLNRVSFISVEDDVSFRYARSDFVLRTLSGDEQALSTEFEQLNNKNIENGNGPTEPQVKSTPEISGDNSNSSFENESNTSSRSVDGSNSNSGYSSDVSPISMSTGEDSGNNSQNRGNTTNKKGMLGNLGKTRRAAVEDINEGRYDAEDDEYSSNSEHSGLCGKQPSQGQNSAKKSKVTQSKKSLAGVKSATDDKSLEENHLHLKKQQSVEHPEQAPMHRVSLFNSFDRNWEEAVQGNDNSKEVLDLGRKCFAAFACMFSSCKHASGRSMFGGTTFRWWVDDDALTNLEEIIAKKEEDQKEDHQAIPIAVIRSLWKTSFFDVEEYSDSEVDANRILDSIQHVLVEDLCFLTAIETPSATCLQLSCDVHAEYGRYILHRFSLQNQLAFWHSRFALELRLLLLDSSLTDFDCE